MLEIAAESRIAHVQVYARGAQVTRTVSLASAPAEELEVVVGGITPLAEAGSLRAQAGSGRQVVALRSALVVPHAPSTPGPALAWVRELGLRVEQLGVEQGALEARRRALLDITWQPAFDGRDKRLEPARRMADALAVARLCGDLAAAIEPELRQLEDELDTLRKQLEAARLEAAQATSSERAGAGHPTRELRVRLGGGSGGALELSFTYVVGAARWWPAYAARLADGGARAELELAAFVAQASGEDWNGVALALSTADLVADARLPELASLRLSRRQPPARRGYRSPPPGLDAMFEAHDGALAALPPAPPPPLPRPARAPAPRKRPATEPGMGRNTGSSGAVLAEADEESRDTGSFGAVLAGADDETLSGSFPDQPPMPVMARVPMPAAAMAPPAPSGAPQTMRMRSAAAPAGGGGAPAPKVGYAAAAPGAIEPGDAWLDFDSLELAPGDAGGQRGRLRQAPAPGEGGISRAQAAHSIEVVQTPARAIDPRASRGMFDHRYEAGAALDLPSDTRAHRVPLAIAAAPARPRFVTVPRESAEVYREVELDNPFGAPLLPGPCEVFVEGVLLTTTSLGEVGKGGTIALGLGVEDRLRVARNARTDEQSAGLLGGATTVDHRVTIDLRSSLGRPVTVEVIDRVPVSDDDDIEITRGGKPAPEPYEQVERGAPVRGGLRWRVPLAPGGQASIEHTYRVKLSARNEIAGGNRRE